MFKAGLTIANFGESGNIIGTMDELETLEATGEYVFHGSPYEIKELEPRQATNAGLPDGEPAVWASDLPVVAIFMALVGGRYSSGVSITNGEVELTAVRSGLTALRGDKLTGYVHVLPKEQFTKVKQHDYVSTKPQHPVEVIKVKAKDLRLPVGLKEENR